MVSLLNYNAVTGTSSTATAATAKWKEKVSSGYNPPFQPGERYQYVSGCNLRTEMGKMYGTYIMENLHNKKTFEVNIPVFEMIVPFKMS